LTEAFLWIQLVAEGSLSKWRALGVAITRARRVNVEGSAIQFNQRRDAVKSEENVRTFEEECQCNRRRTQKQETRYKTYRPKQSYFRS